jgi:hypothetical protein
MSTIIADTWINTYQGWQGWHQHQTYCFEHIANLAHRYLSYNGWLQLQLLLAKSLGAPTKSELNLPHQIASLPLSRKLVHCPSGVGLFKVEFNEPPSRRLMKWHLLRERTCSGVDALHVLD